MESIAVLVYRIVEKEFTEDRDALAEMFIIDQLGTVKAFAPRAFKLIQSTVVDAGRRQSDQTSYLLHVALEGVFSLQEPAYLERKERLEEALRTSPLVQRGGIDIELQEEEIYSLAEYSERFSHIQ